MTLTSLLSIRAFFPKYLALIMLEGGLFLMLIMVLLQEVQSFMMLGNYIFLDLCILKHMQLC